MNRSLRALRAPYSLLLCLLFTSIALCTSGYGAAEVIITEIHFNPDGDDNAREFIELKNVGDEVADMGGWEFTRGVDRTFPVGTTLAPGAFMVIVANQAQFQANYPGVPVFGTYGDDDDPAALGSRGALDNADERITLEDGSGVEIFDVQYWDGNGPDNVEELTADEDDFERGRWPETPDGDDYTLVSLNPNDNSDPNDYRSWRPSINLHGSPGADEPQPAPLQEIYINEVRTRDGLLDNDAVELYNPGATAVDVSNWFLSDNLDNPTKSPIPAGSVVPAGGYLVLVNDGVTFDLSISSKGERVFLYSANAAGALTGWVHGLHTEASEDGKTFARFVGSDGKESFIADDPSLGMDNGPAAAPRVVIQEIMYSPAFSNSVEYVKIANVGTATALLYDVQATGDNMSIGGFGITLPGFQPTLAAGQDAYITNVAEALFRASYDVDPAAVVFADAMGGGLSGGGELLELRLPITIDNESRPVPTNVASGRYYTVIDEVCYDDDEPWPVEADGLGYSLVRISPADGYEAANWQRSDTRGGSAFGGGGPVYVNEVLSHTDLPQVDVIELFNAGSTAVDIGGWFLTDDPLVPNKYTIPVGTTIPAGGYFAVNEDNDANSNTAPAGYFGGGAGFSVSSRGDDVWLFSANSVDLTGYAHGGSFRATQNGVAVIRQVNSVGQETFPPESGSPTVAINRFVAFPTGAVNNAPLVERAVISEIFYAPNPGDVEFVEVHNISGVNLALYDTTAGGNPGNNWQLDGVTFTFPGNQPILQPDERVVIIPQGASVSAFRAQYSVPASVTIHGDADGFVGALDNGGEEIALVRPDNPDLVSGQIIVPLIEVDSVTYRSDSTWPSGAGKSIERIDDTAFGNEPLNWQTSPTLATPGTGPSGVTGYAAWAAAEFTAAELAGPNTGPADDFNGDCYSNLHAYAFGYSPKAVPDAGLLPSSTVVVANNPPSDAVAIAFRQRIDRSDLTYQVETSANMLSWSPTSNPVGAAIDNLDGTETVVHAGPVGFADVDRYFLRLIIEYTP